MYPSHPKLTIIIAAVFALGIILSITLVLTLPKSEQPVITPLSKQRAQNQSPQTSPIAQNPSYYINTAQQFLVHAEERSQNQNQNETNKKEILVLVQSALDTINNGISIYPRDDRLFAQRAKIYQGIISFSPKAIEAAISDLEQARQLSPQNPVYPKTQSQLFAQKGDFQSAAYYTRIVYEIEPTNLENLANLGKIQVKAGQINNALQSYQKLLSLLPQENPQYQPLQEEIKALKTLLAKADTETNSTLQIVNENPPEIKEPSSIELLPQEQASLSQNLIIAAPKEENSQSQNSQIDLNAVAGEATLPANKEEIKIINNNIDNQKQIYIAPKGDIQNRILYVKTKNAESEEKYFVVALNKPFNQDIQFTWWIIR
ncbi:hypothetical protein COT63_01890 [Candidatus Shapirobacteria bacterium CG09_land_8_20_14_0_10_38_17]|uniref:Uncharacterized protein n=1 Tax=Candidatus Shapirobacteria bacterium CG09_land_8_20_14_0_10_38_17 TaxID=1974884 RepID=A0A2H0WR11_9BACT|nr:MAG: hypothetical protein COT63_01890 [Candidatus Shapirobacteria bacterium CG09_land_8_20_14_0_10_38_17]